MSKISVYIITYNEEEQITEAINSVLWADEIVVVDSGSTDHTCQVAEQLGVRVERVVFHGFGELRNQALTFCQYEWIFNLDADERCTEAVRNEILNLINDQDSQDIYYVPRKNFFMGRWIRYSGWYPNYRQPQLFRNKSLLYNLDLVHEGFIAQSDKIGYLKQPIWQITFKNFEEMVYKANRYSSLGAEKLQRNGKTATLGKALGHGLWAFIKHYIFKLGFLEGWAGFIIALGNFEGTFYRYAKLWERQQQWQLPKQKPVKKPNKS